MSVIFLFDTKAPSNKNWVPRLPSVRIGVLHSALLVPGMLLLLSEVSVVEERAERMGQVLGS